MRISLWAVICAALLAANVYAALWRDEEGVNAIEREAVTRAALATTTTSDPANCHNYYTQSFMETLYDAVGEAAVAECIEEESDSEDPLAQQGSVEVEELDDEEAVAAVSILGGPLDRSSVRLRLVIEDELWKVDEIVEFDLAPGAMERTLTKSLREEGLGDEEIACEIRVYRRNFTSEDFEAALEQGEEPQLPESVRLDYLACMETDTQRRILARILTETGRDRGEDPSAIACVARRVRDLPGPVVERVVQATDPAEADRIIEGLIESCRTTADPTNVA